MRRRTKSNGGDRIDTGKPPPGVVDTATSTGSSGSGVSGTCSFSTSSTYSTSSLLLMLLVATNPNVDAAAAAAAAASSVTARGPSFRAAASRYCAIKRRGDAASTTCSRPESGSSSSGNGNDGGGGRREGEGRMQEREPPLQLRQHGDESRGIGGNNLLGVPPVKVRTASGTTAFLPPESTATVGFRPRRNTGGNGGSNARIANNRRRPSVPALPSSSACASTVESARSRSQASAPSPSASPPMARGCSRTGRHRVKQPSHHQQQQFHHLRGDSNGTLEASSSLEQRPREHPDASHDNEQYVDALPDRVESPLIGGMRGLLRVRCQIYIDDHGGTSTGRASDRGGGCGGGDGTRSDVPRRHGGRSLPTPSTPPSSPPTTTTTLSAYVDTGAQVTVLSAEAARRAGLFHLLDRRYSGRATGVGHCRILGRISAGCATIVLGGTDNSNNKAVSSCHAQDAEDLLSMPCPQLTVLESTGTEGIDLLLGLDVLEEHGATICLRDRTLAMSKTTSKHCGINSDDEGLSSLTSTSSRIAIPIAGDGGNDEKACAGKNTFDGNDSDNTHNVRRRPRTRGRRTPFADQALRADLDLLEQEASSIPFSSSSDKEDDAVGSCSLRNGGESKICDDDYSSSVSIARGKHEQEFFGGNDNGELCFSDEEDEDDGYEGFHEGGDGLSSFDMSGV